VRHLGLDVGDERIGVAISDESGWLARPLTILSRRPGPSSYLELVRLAEENGAGAIVVGLPLLPDGSPGKQVRSTEAYVRGLKAHTSLPITYWDERYTTAEAREVTREGSRPRARDRRRVDDVAAALILQDYLDHHQEASRHDESCTPDP
jgi:putative holliday junction resolvase